MGVRRTQLEFEGNYTQVPNAWARDKRLSRKARGLLVEIMSHRVGWHVSVSGLMAAGTEGRDAIKSALVELKDLGYLVVSQSRRERGRFGEVEYELHDPTTGDGFSVPGGLTADGLSADGLSASGQSAPYKNTIPIEDHLEEDHLPELPIELEPPTSFDDFWAVWPRKDSRRDAERAWQKAVGKASPEVIVSAARVYAESPYRPEKKFVPYGATWLNGERWTDPAPEPPERRDVPGGPNDRLRAGLAMGARLQAQVDARGRGELTA